MQLLLCNNTFLRVGVNFVIYITSSLHLTLTFNTLTTLSIRRSWHVLSMLLCGRFYTPSQKCCWFTGQDPYQASFHVNYVN